MISNIGQVTPLHSQLTLPLHFAVFAKTTKLGAVFKQSICHYNHEMLLLTPIQRLVFPSIYWGFQAEWAILSSWPVLGLGLGLCTPFRLETVPRIFHGTNQHSPADVAAAIAIYASWYSAPGNVSPCTRAGESLLNCLVYTMCRIRPVFTCIIAANAETSSDFLCALLTLSIFLPTWLDKEVSVFIPQSLHFLKNI